MLVGGAAVVAMSVFTGCTTSSPPTLEPESIPAAVAGRYYEVPFTTSGGATVHSNNVPQGLELATAAGHGFLFGVPETEGQYTFHVRAGSGGPTMFTTPGSTDRDYTLTVGPASGDSGLILDDYFGSFTENVPVTVDLSGGARGGQQPYRFAPFCLQTMEICNESQTGDRLPDGVSLSAEGLLFGTVGPKPGVSASPHDRRIDFIACVIDGAGARACSTIELYELAPPVPAPSGS